MLAVPLPPLPGEPLMSMESKVEKRRRFLARLMKLPAAAALIGMIGPEKLLADSEGE